MPPFVVWCIFIGEKNDSMSIKEEKLKQIICEAVNSVLNDTQRCTYEIQSILDFATDVNFYDLNKMESYVTIENEETFVSVNFSYEYDYTPGSLGNYEEEPQNPSIDIKTVNISSVSYWSEEDSKFHSIPANTINQSLITEIIKSITYWLEEYYVRGGFEVD